jgi:pimeloyl-ACP methyl ester carboxylesterase
MISSPPRSGQIAARAGAAIAASAAVAGLGRLAWRKVAVARPDAFYTPPADMSRTSGALIRSEPVEASWVPAAARAWRILYVTTDIAGQPTAASALVIVPRGATAAHVIAWAHATSGIDPASAPSLAKTGPASGGLYILDRVVAEGWAVVATDYPGLGTSTPHAWLSGAPAAHAVLDSLRAARRLAAAKLAERTVVWGYSQGGQAALWTGMIVAEYAPEIRLEGVAAFAPVSRPAAVVKHLAEHRVVGATMLTSYAIAAYSRTYPDVDFDAYVRSSQRAHVRRVARNGFLNPLTMVTALIDRAVRPGIFQRAPDVGPLGERLAQNEADGAINVPLLIAQGKADELVPPAMQDDFVAARRAQGQDIDYRCFDGLTHLSLVQPRSPFIPELIEWTRARFAA